MLLIVKFSLSINLSTLTDGNVDSAPKLMLKKDVMNKFIRERWGFLAFCFCYSLLAIVQHEGNTTVTGSKIFVCLVVAPILGYLFDTKVKFKYKKSGPLPIYKSPVIWLGVPVLIILIFTFI